MLDLSKFVARSDASEVHNPYFKLYGMIHHMGSLNGGHYTATCKNQ